MSGRRAVGTYALVLALPCTRELSVGRLGRFTFPAGFYVYAGSALGGLEARLGRHFRGTKRLHWHVDYLAQAATAVDAYAYLGKVRRECELAASLVGLPGARLPAPRFGASDCNCPAHLIWLPERPDLARRIDWLRPFGPVDKQIPP